MRLPVKLLLLIAFVMTLWCLAEDVTGPAPIGTNVTRPPVVVGGVAYPSPDASPVAKGKADRIATDGAGAVWVKVLGSLASSISGTVNVTLPASSPLPVQGTLPSGSPVGTLPLLPVLVAPSPVQVTSANSTGILVQGPVAHDATYAGNPLPVGGFGYETGFLPTSISASGDTVRALYDIYGQARVVLVDDAGAALGGTGRFKVLTDASSSQTGTDRYCDPAHAGGSSEVTIKGSAGNLYDLHVSNPNTTDVFLLIWNASNPTPGTTSPTMSFCIPGGSGSSNRGVYDLVLAHPAAFSTAITATVVTAANGSSAPSSAVDLNIGYK